MTDIFYIVLRSATVYLCIVLLIRIFGKKELSQLSVIDLVFILLISNSVQNAMVGNNSSLEGGLIAATTLFGLNALIRVFIFKFRPVEKFLQGEVVVLIQDGEVNMENLKKEKITMEELSSSVREHGIKDISAVDLAILETDGNISVLSENYKRKTVRKRKQHKVLKHDE